MVVSKFLGSLEGSAGEVKVDKSYVTTGSIMFDAVLVPGGRESVDALRTHGDALHFISEAFKHGKPIGAVGEGVDLLGVAHLPGISLADDGQTRSEHGVVTDRAGGGSFAPAFLEALAEHRHWGRDLKETVPA
jgi:catalase